MLAALILSIGTLFGGLLVLNVTLKTCGLILKLVASLFNHLENLIP